MSGPDKSKGKAVAEAPAEGGFVALRRLVVGELKAISPPLVAVPIALAWWLVWGALNQIKKNDADAAGWDPSDFSNLAWLTLLSLVALFVVGLRRQQSGTLTLVGLAGMLTFAAAVATFSNAWATERQNYWDAYHFATLFWMAAGSAVISLAALIVAGRRGSGRAKALQGPAAVCVLILFVGWLWTWNPWLQGVEGWIARAMFLATHN